jgi:phenylacetate-CoA ligase
MSLLTVVKKRVEFLPEWVGRPLSNVPFALRLGPEYVEAQRSIACVERMGCPAAMDRTLQQLKGLVRFAVDNVEFYRTFYRDKGFSPIEVQTLADWDRVPVITKADLQGVPLEARTARGATGVKINTGGTSGQPLEFYQDSHAFAREWAHMHFIWKAHGYRPQHLKLTFRGKHFDPAHVLRYNAVHNEYVVNANAPMEAVVRAVMSLPRRTVIRWLHGYPSLIAEFAHAVAGLSDMERAAFRARLFGALLGSEYPVPMYRTVIEDVLTANVVSWYGHSEMAVLARETAKGVYESLPTYGFTEAVPAGPGSDCRLVCTSLHNRVHPFIRYDTGDLVEPVSRCSGSLAFRITEGRVGDFIHDRQGRRHSLTAVIFGRHHAAFELVQHLQVREEASGVVTLVVTPRNPEIDEASLCKGFDLDDLDIEWRFQVVVSPVRTQAGKIRLKIS